MIHPLSDVKSSAIGPGTSIWQFAVVLRGAKIGANCNINCHTFIENYVVIGDNVTVKSGVYIWDGITIEDDVFIGPAVAFVNNSYPRSKQYPDEHTGATVKKGASIGANATIMGNLEIGTYAMVGAGSVVTKCVPARALVVGVPAKIVGWLNEDGSKMKFENDCYLANDGTRWHVIENKLIKK
ncbi:acyltransferase [Pontibacter virosus]|uniref:Transferase family hexapeptide repeat protein n=1 Tax=Pontibacter virosus TaxID=1765052 RepID=A0A2U1B2X5_9BACT|nr:acyltransferase [Pontibacter virosus]PVY43036.1 transferase family hexapeptide repeat protein [Pontibacter virosus]